MVDCGATEHVINDKTKFINFDQNFDPQSHFIELVDGSRINNLVLKRGDACIHLQDINGHICKCILKNALYIPTFKQNIFSVQAATKSGAHMNFGREKAELLLPDGTIFNIIKKERLYYLKNITSAKKVSYDLNTWHRILGHCNESDIKQLPQLVKGMTIQPNDSTRNCEICIQGKMTENRSRTPDKKATKILSRPL